MLRLRTAALLAAPVVFSACSVGDPTPDQIRRGFVTRVVVNDFPVYNIAENVGWDGGNVNDEQADVYFRLLGRTDADELLNSEQDDIVVIDDNDGDPSNNPNNYGNAGDGDTPLVWDVENYEINVLDRTLRLELKDDDSGAFDEDDRMSVSSEFRLEDYIPSDLSGNRTVGIDVSSPDGEFDARITVRFER